MDGLKDLAIIVDIDGTIADINHRLHFIQKKKAKDKNYNGFHLACKADKPILDMIYLIETLRLTGCGQGRPCKLIFVTGRPEQIREDTEHWLSRYFNLSFECRLFMREDGDKRPDYVIKREIYETHIKENYDVAYVFEDRELVVKMWREQGLRCFQVADVPF